MKLSPKKAAAVAGVSRSLVYAWIGSQSLPHYRLGRAGRRGRIVIEEDDLLAFLRNQRVEARSLPAAGDYELRHIR